jgi:NADH pyrophosphatase NudC (nudix superfamily)
MNDEKRDDFFTQAKDEAGFTNGPWVIERHGNAWVLFSRENESQHGLNLMYIADPDWNFEANKKLIEAAPDLYHELEKLVKTLDSLGHYVDTRQAKFVLEKIKTKINCPACGHGNYKIIEDEIYHCNTCESEFDLCDLKEEE